MSEASREETRLMQQNVQLRNELLRQQRAMDQMWHAMNQATKDLSLERVPRPFGSHVYLDALIAQVRANLQQRVDYYRPDGPWDQERTWQ